ncbi:MAG: PEP-CTERM sorting domain-containing protein [Puniceicoccales bacterium]
MHIQSYCNNHSNKEGYGLHLKSCSRTAGLMVIGLMACSHANAMINHTIVFDSDVEVSSLNLFGNNRVTYELTPTAPVGSYEADFSSLGDTLISVTFAAAEGQAFRIDVPEGVTSPQIHAEAIWGEHSFSFSGSINETDPDISVTNFEESAYNAPNFSTGNVRLENGSVAIPDVQFTSSATLVAGESYEFTSVTVSYVVPSSWNVDYDTDPHSFSLFVNVTVPGGGPAPADPVLRVVPEPSTYAVIAGAVMLGIVMLRRRRK